MTQPEIAEWIASRVIHAIRNWGIRHRLSYAYTLRRRFFLELWKLPIGAHDHTSDSFAAIWGLIDKSQGGIMVTEQRRVLHVQSGGLSGKKWKLVDAVDDLIEKRLYP